MTVTITYSSSPALCADIALKPRHPAIGPPDPCMSAMTPVVLVVPAGMEKKPWTYLTSPKRVSVQHVG